jgi:hypothetical protein
VRLPLLLSWWREAWSVRLMSASAWPSYTMAMAMSGIGPGVAEAGRKSSILLTRYLPKHYHPYLTRRDELLPRSADER